MTRLEIARVAVEAGVDPRTVARALDGNTRSAAVRIAIHAALVALGYKREAMRLERKKMHTPKRKATK